MINNKPGKVLFTLTFLITLFSWQVSVAAMSTLYFYNPESNLNDFRSLKTGFDTYLLANGAYQFQPFNNQKTFEEYIKTHKSDVFFLSSWHYHNLVKQGYANLKPILIGTLKGKYTDTKVLFTKKNITHIEELQGKRIASATDQDYTEQMLKNMATQKSLQTNRSFKVLTVPKDIDALMSVLFGMAQGALTARITFNTFAKLNPRKHRLLRKQAESHAIMLPLIVAYKPIAKSSTKKLLNAIEEMPNSANGKAVLGMLGLDDWKKFTSADRQLLAIPKLLATPNM